MTSDKLEKFLAENDATLKHFCEVGVYEYRYCSLQKQIEAGKRVTLVECFPRCIVDIRKNIEGKTNVTLHEVAIADESGDAEMTDVGAATYMSDTVRSPASIAGYQSFGRFLVKKDTFDKYDDGTIDVLYIDTEGAEWYCLKHAISRPKIIRVETHYARYLNPHIERITAWMKANGYVEFDKTDSDTIFIK